MYSVKHVFTVTDDPTIRERATELVTPSLTLPVQAHSLER